MIEFSEEEKIIGERIFKKFDYGRLHNFEWPIMDFKDLFRILNREETELIYKILKISPRSFGVRGEFFGVDEMPKNIIMIKDQKYFIFGETRTVKPQYLPEDIFRIFQKMNAAMQNDIERSINVQSGYRSPAYQLVLFFYYLYKNQWDFKKTLSIVAFPGWSEHHGYPKKQAVDIAPAKGIKQLDNFYKTKEYKWLAKNSAKFGFYLSFPKSNESGIKFEPWHWHYKKKK